MDKKRIFIGTLLILLLSSLYHFIYDWFPNMYTSFLFPINESIWEHNKMILLAFLTWTLLESIFLKDSKNPLFKNLVACIICIILVLSVFTPVFFFILDSQDNILVTLVIYVISIMTSLWLSEFIKLKSSKPLELLSIGGFVTLIVTFAILTYYHPDNLLFKEFVTTSYSKIYYY